MWGVQAMLQHKHALLACRSLAVPQSRLCAPSHAQVGSGVKVAGVNIVQVELDAHNVWELHHQLDV